MDKPTSQDQLAAVEAALELTLPNDFKTIAKFFSGDLLGGISHYAIAVDGPATNIATETLRLRAASGLAHRFVVLAEPPCSLIVLDVLSGAVIWCDACDVGRLEDPTQMTSRVDRWSSYAAFFAYLLNEEEQEGREFPCP